MDRALLSVLLQRIQTCGSHGDYGLQNAGPGHCQVRKQFELQTFTCTDNEQIIRVQVRFRLLHIRDGILAGILRPVPKF